MWRLTIYTVLNCIFLHIIDQQCSFFKYKNFTYKILFCTDYRFLHIYGPIKAHIPPLTIAYIGCGYIGSGGIVMSARSIGSIHLIRPPGQYHRHLSVLNTAADKSITSSIQPINQYEEVGKEIDCPCRVFVCLV